MKLIDTHNHIYLEDFDPEQDILIREAQESGIDTLLLPNVDLETVDRLHDLCARYPDFAFPMMGLHPTSVKENYTSDLKQIESYLHKHTYCAIGEIGIDLFWDKTYKKQQIEVFEEQLRWSINLDLPVAIHTRDAYPEVLESIYKVGPEKLSGVFHSFTGTKEDLEEIKKLSHFKIGINGVVTFKKYGSVTITATCPEGDEPGEGFAKSVEFTLNIPAGYYNDVFKNGSNLLWDRANNGQIITWKEGGMENYVEIVPYQQNATKARGDFKRTQTTYISKDFPILCFRFDDFVDMGIAGISKRNINLDTSGNSEDGTKFSGNFGGSNNKWKTKYLCSDGSAIFIYDLDTQTFATGGAFPDGTVGTFSTFQIKYADIETAPDASSLMYRFFWFKTFQSEEDLNTFLNEWSAETGITYE